MLLYISLYCLGVLQLTNNFEIRKCLNSLIFYHGAAILTFTVSSKIFIIIIIAINYIMLLY